MLEIKNAETQMNDLDGLIVRIDKLAWGGVSLS